MSIESALYDILKSAAGVTALIGGSRSPRVYPLGIPKGRSVPAVVYQLASAPDDVTCEGNRGQPDARMVITCWAEDPDGARALADAVYAALTASGAKGTHAGTAVECWVYLDERDIYDPGIENERLERYGTQQDWLVSYSR